MLRNVDDHNRTEHVHALERRLQHYCGDDVRRHEKVKAEQNALAQVLRQFGNACPAETARLRSDTER